MKVKAVTFLPAMAAVLIITCLAAVWIVFSRNFPVNTQVKGIEKIIVVGDERVPAGGSGFGGIFIIQGGELSYKSPGNLLMVPYRRELVKVGESSRSVDGNE